MEKKMKKIGLQMSVLMGVTLSFCLSLVGNISGAKNSGEFSIPGFLLSFLLSTVISIVLGLVIPIKKIGDGATKGMKPGFGKNCVESLISDCIYTPILTFCMVLLNWKIATGHGAKIPFVPMFIKSLIILMLVGFVLIMIFQPLYLKLVMKKNGVSMGGPNGPNGPGAPGERPEK